jgi:hypothetical protein
MSLKERREALNRLFDSWSWGSPHADEENTIPLLSELVRRAGAKFTFVFDFGDWWAHTVRVEKIEPALADASYPRCIDGAGVDPLEYCGGPGSLMEVFAAVMCPEHHNLMDQRSNNTFFQANCATHACRSSARFMR